MKLCDLVTYRNQLDALCVAAARDQINLELNKYHGLLDKSDLAQERLDIELAFDQLCTSVSGARDKLTSALDQAEKPWLQQSYTLYDEKIKQYSADHIFDVCMPLQSVEFINTMTARLNLYAAWQHAGMFIRPGHETYINQLVGLDPLYVLDSDYKLLEPAVEQFNQAYQKRLRQYQIKDNTDETILERLPDNQFAFCVAYMYFNYRPMEIIKKYLEELYQKLKPGGILAFTFNDCDYLAAAQLVEEDLCCYTPGRMLQDLATAIGYTVEYSWHEPNHPVTWIELRRPGVLNSLKGGQTLAKILPKLL